MADGRTGGRSVLPARALFVFIGVRPCTGWLGGLVDLDGDGFVRTGQDTGRSALETSLPGIFAVGDVRGGSARRVATAVGEGAMAIRLRLRKNPARIAGRRIPGRRGTMTHATWPDGADVLARASRHWGWMMAFGIISLVVGVAVLAWPGRTLIVVAVLFGIQLVVTGIFRFVAAFASEDLTGGTRVLLAVLGVLSLIIGLYAVRHVLVTLLALALLLGIYWIVNGAVELFMALSAPGVPGRGWTVVVGVLSVLAGLLVLVYPAISLLTLVVVLSVWLLVLGLMEITLAIRARSAGRRIEDRELHPV